ncbi:sodium channel modifier 1-like isoform X1 [Sycon ciliatum]|uniref:sodium channel modifier 1-like isoform X1 n=1 Tax=Sycon ciliatum TaxID=27933 RepID=UPI0031F67983
MSFKLVGDQFSQIKQTQKRRRCDLLLESVPDDEALLMKNGRFACLVCSWRPTFDTLEMLAVHRQSQKHADAMVKRIEQQASLQLEIMKREQNLAAAGGHSKGLPSSQRSGPNVRQSPSSSSHPPPLVTDTRERVTRALSQWSVPYDPRVSGGRHSGAASAPASSRVQGVSQGVYSNRGSSLCQAPHSSSLQAESATVAAVKDSADTQYVFPARAGVAKKKKKKTAGSSAASTSASTQQSAKGSTTSSEAEKKATRVQRLLESGWVLCNDGSWVRDPSAEFDSDEEPPSPL